MFALPLSLWKADQLSCRSGQLGGGGTVSYYGRRRFSFCCLGGYAEPRDKATRDGRPRRTETGHQPAGQGYAASLASAHIMTVPAWQATKALLLFSLAAESSALVVHSLLSASPLVVKSETAVKVLMTAEALQPRQIRCLSARWPHRRRRAAPKSFLFMTDSGASSRDNDVDQQVKVRTKNEPCSLEQLSNAGWKVSILL